MAYTASLAKQEFQGQGKHNKFNASAFCSLFSRLFRDVTTFARPMTRRFWNRHSEEKHTALLYKNYFKDTSYLLWLGLIEIAFFFNQITVLLLAFCSFYFILPNFILFLYFSGTHVLMCVQGGTPPADYILCVLREDRAGVKLLVSDAVAWEL